MSYSSLVSYVRLSPNKSSRDGSKIDTISIHCMAGNCSIEGLGSWFSKESTNASSNYGVGTDGRIGMYVEFDFAPLISSSEDQIINLFRMIRDNNLDDIEVMTQKLIKSGNTRFLRAIVKNFNVSI